MLDPMNSKQLKAIRQDHPPEGRALLRLVADPLADPALVPGDPSTHLGYKECCVALGVAPPDADLPWGRMLQPHGLNDLNGWTQRHDFPRITGLIVNQMGDRQYWPGGDYFVSNGRQDMGGTRWEQQAREAAALNWRPFL